jgi:two-component system cell cycle sensor histidine kinase/response regulator CckA
MATAHSARNNISAADTQILVVEDEAAILELTVSVLRDEGYRVTSAINGDVALVILQQGLPFRLLITDIAMPGLLDGYALARKARELQPEMQIIYMTGFASMASVRSRGAPYGQTIVKPWTSQVLLATVASVIRLRA